MIKRVLIIGSGGIKIGEAGEFDYSTSQALKALKEEGIETILVNPNVATIQTDKKLATKVYLLPIEPEYIEEIIAKEKPDGVLLGFGGQTALNCGIKMEETFKKFGVRVLGTSIESIEIADNRQKFRECMEAAGVPVLPSKAAHTVDEALTIAATIGYPVMVRVAYTLGGGGTGAAHNPEELKKVAHTALAQSMIAQILVERYVGGWKEIEYEIVRDARDNCIAVCNMENFDPMGVHTGDSIVVAPSQTLNDNEYHMLREAGIRAVRALKIVGECNIQFALRGGEFYAIEINSRLSRSSALASKATGYPLAYIAAKIAIGHKLPEIINKVTKKTTACFEPALDYIVVKIPRWDFKKFEGADNTLGTEMKSVGEVMAIGRTFEEAIQKAVRMLEIGEELMDSREPRRGDLKPTDRRLFEIIDLLRSGGTVNEVHKLTSITPWFLEKLNNLVTFEPTISEENLLQAKKLGFSDSVIAKRLKKNEYEVRKLRKLKNIYPVVKQIDTLAAEWPAHTNYLFLTYNGSENDVLPTEKKKVVVLGSGTFRIGSSVEFDWCSVNCVQGLQSLGVESIIINCNPETVSTDYDIADRLYFEEINFEKVMDIYRMENPFGVVLSVGGQTPNNLARALAGAGVRVLGTPVESIDNAEDRTKFSQLLDFLGIKQPEWATFADISSAKVFAKDRYPVLVRPSYVLSGASMRVLKSEKDWEKLSIPKTAAVTISEFIEGAKEVEVDGVCDGYNIYIGGIMEHVEYAGVHSGDATMVLPPQSLSGEVIDKLEEYSEKIARALNIRGLFNIQYLVKGTEVQVIECNLRASRSMPFVSKVTGANLVEMATKIMLGSKLPPQPEKLKRVGVKAAQFSFARLRGADPVLGVEMHSTGEVACLGTSFDSALLAALAAAQTPIPTNNTIMFAGPDSVLKKIEQVTTHKLLKWSGDLEPIRSRKVELVISIPNGDKELRQTAVRYRIPLITDERLAIAALKASAKRGGREIIPL